VPIRIDTEGSTRGGGGRASFWSGTHLAGPGAARPIDPAEIQEGHGFQRAAGAGPTTPRRPPQPQRPIRRYIRRLDSTVHIVRDEARLWRVPPGQTAYTQAELARVLRLRPPFARRVHALKVALGGRITRVGSVGE